jgi:hypothetical protein
VRENSSVSLRGSRGQCDDSRGGWYGQFAGILQEKLRQRGARVRMLLSVVCEGDMREHWSRDLWHNR